MVATLDELVETYSEDEALEDTLAIATTAELPTTTYAEGDTTLTLLEILSYWVAQSRGLSRVAIAGGILDFAEDDEWLTLHAKDVYDVDRVEATFASATVTVTNDGTDTFVVGANDITFTNSTTGKTYRNSSPSVGTVTLAPGDVEDFDVVADEAGSASSADPGDIDTIASGQLGLTCTNPAAAVGRDREGGDSLKRRCRLKAPAISRTGAAPAGKYAYVALTPEANGGADITRCDVRGNTITGSVTVVLAGPSGAISGGDRDLVEEALVDKVVGPCESLTVISATNQGIAVTYQAWVYDDVNLDSAELQAQISARLASLLALCPIGGWKKDPAGTGYVWLNLIEATIKGTSSRIFQVEVSLPAGDTSLTANQVPVLTTVTPTVTLVEAPSSGGTL